MATAKGACYYFHERLTEPVSRVYENIADRKLSGCLSFSASPWSPEAESPVDLPWPSAACEVSLRSPAGGLGGDRVGKRVISGHAESRGVCGTSIKVFKVMHREKEDLAEMLSLV